VDLQEDWKKKFSRWVRLANFAPLFNCPKLEWDSRDFGSKPSRWSWRAIKSANKLALTYGSYFLIAITSRFTF